MRAAVHPAPTSPARHHASALADHASLTWVLARKNFQIRYKRASLGVLWAVLQPAFQAAFLSFVFIKIFQIDRVPHYPIYVLSGVLPWAFFTKSVNAAMTAIADNGSLVRKVSMPLAIFPLAAVGGTALAFSGSLIVLFGASAVAGVLGWHVLWLPLAVALEVLLVIAIGLNTSAFHPAFRDIKYLVESALLVGFYASPILYDLGRVPGRYRTAIELNPMSGVLSLMRAAVLGRPINGTSVLAAVAWTLVLTATGSFFFRRRAAEFPDLL